MDSGNSGSMQSSSGGGDEEYESRGESFTSFLNPSGGQFGSISDHHHHHPPPQPSFLSHQYQNTLFNPNTQNLEAAFAHSSSANTQYGNDIVWSRGLTSQTNHHQNFENLIALSSSPSFSSSNQSLFGTSQMLNQPQFASSSSSSMPSQSIEANNPPRKSDHPSIAKNPKKRTRASRRAPTTVLPTDTTNFRQMVQQFTGIPTAPFSSSSPYSRRQDLFSGGSGMRSGNLDGLNLNPFYPLRPSAQKLQISPFLAQSSSSSSNLSSTMIEALMSSTNTMNQSTTNNAASTTPQNLLSMQNQILSFNQHALPTSLKNSSPISGTNSPTANTDVTPRNLGSTIRQGGVTVSSFDDYGLRHENVNIQQLGSNIRGNYKLNCSGSRSEFHSDKGVENVSSSGEGTVGPWISPDDH